MVVGEDGHLPLPWLSSALSEAVRAERGHALLLQGSPGVGALEFAAVLAQSRLCESPTSAGIACGRCASCRLVHSHSHPDLFVLLPETLRRERGWLLADDKLDGEDGKRKPSRQIRIDDVRSLLEWVGKTAGLGRGKQVVLHPAEALNDHAASALLKTLEEPPAGTQLVITCTARGAVLPTIRSRCQFRLLARPGADAATRWMTGQGIARPEVLLAACDGEPLTARALAAAGIDAAAWESLPAAMVDGRPRALSGWPMSRMLDALLKLCHDAMALAVGGKPRYFPPAALAEVRASLPALSQWHRELLHLAQTADHPWHEALAADALTARARRAFVAAPRGSGGRRLDTLPS